MAPFGFIDDGTPEEEKEIIDEYGTVWHPVTRKGLQFWYIINISKVEF